MNGGVILNTSIVIEIFVAKTMLYNLQNKSDTHEKLPIISVLFAVLLAIFDILLKQICLVKCTCVPVDLLSFMVNQTVPSICFRHSSESFHKYPKTLKRLYQGYPPVFVHH